MNMNSYDAVLDFWFKEIDPAKWWKKDSAFDELIRQRFLDLHTKASKCELYAWRRTPRGRLAEIIVLDQFSRNIFRDKAKSFQTDSLALALAQEAVSVKTDKALTNIENSFLYMPYMHSESIAIHALAVDLYRENGIESSFDFEIKHKEIIDQFGRYPHRNNILNRQSTQDEIDFLQQPGSAF